MIWLVLGLYILALVTVGYLGHMPRLPASANQELPQVSLVISFRDEEPNLGRLVNSIRALTFPAENLEVIFVDDGSNDGGAEWLARQLPPNGYLIKTESQEQGKKAALAAGISRARGAIIVTTDADCEMKSEWLHAVVMPFANPAVQLATGEVRILLAGFFAACQHLEFSTIMLLTRAFIRLGKPIMCNGANLAFRRQAYERVGGYQSHRHVASGDDEFLMRSILARFGDAAVAWHHGVVQTLPQPSIRDFLAQRIRWASKWRYNTSLPARGTALLTFGLQSLLLAVWFSGAWLGMPGFFCVILKTLADVVFLYAIRPKHSNLFASIAVSVVYPAYVVVVALAALAGVPQRWKGRSLT